MSHVSVALFTSTAVAHWPDSFSPGLLFTVTPPAPATVTCPAPVCTMVTLAPTGKATEELSGTVKGNQGAGEVCDRK